MYNSNDQVVQDHVGDQDWGFPTSDDGRHHGSESVHERERKLSQAGLDKLKYEVEKETQKQGKVQNKAKQDAGSLLCLSE